MNKKCLMNSTRNNIRTQQRGDEIRIYLNTICVQTDVTTLNIDQKGMQHATLYTLWI